MFNLLLRPAMALAAVMFSFHPALAQDAYGVTRGPLTEAAVAFCDHVGISLLDAGQDDAFFSRAKEKRLDLRWGQRFPNPIRTVSPTGGYWTDRDHLDLYASARVADPVVACQNEYMTDRAGDGGEYGPGYFLDILLSGGVGARQTRENRAKVAFIYAAAARVILGGFCTGTDTYWTLVPNESGGHSLACGDLATRVLVDSVSLRQRQTYDRYRYERPTCEPMTFVPPRGGEVVAQCVPLEAYRSILKRVGTGEPQLCVRGYYTFPNGRRTCR